MATWSDHFKSYKKSLIESRERYLDLYTERSENGNQFYQNFFNKLIVPFSQKFEDPMTRHLIHQQIERFVGTNEIDFVAIDGTCQKDAFNDFIVFFGGAYGAKGRISLQGGSKNKIKYQKWEINRDVSMVAWVPVPFAELSDVTNEDAIETFMTSDKDRVNLSNIHTSLMQLAEIFLAYNVATSSIIDNPRLILLDQSMSSIMAAASHGVDTGLIGYPYDRRKLDHADVMIAFAHPFNSDLKIPSSKLFRGYTAILAEFHNCNTQTISIRRLEQALKLDRQKLRSAINYLTKERFSKRGRERTPICSFDEKKDTLTISVNCKESWEYTVSLFQNIGKKLFIEKDSSALTYDSPDPDHPQLNRRRWMSPEDIQFLIAIGLRALIEVCWAKHIILIGIVKDSDSRYLTRNYLGVMKHLNVYPELQNLTVGPLPWTDRIYLETIPHVCDGDICQPWSSIEFDSTFMTLHLGEEIGLPKIMGVKTGMGEIVAPERMFLRSLGQFYLNRTKKTPLAGHVIFIDRLAYPEWDKSAANKVVLNTDQLGTINPIVYHDNSTENLGQLISMYLLSTLTHNHFPEVIGYPDPLHKADWGAKSVGKRIRNMILSSEIPFRCKPIAKTFRSIRDSRGR